MRIITKKIMIATVVAIMAAATTRVALKAWTGSGSIAATKTEQPTDTETSTEKKKDFNFEVEDQLAEEGWLLARADSDITLSYAVIPGKDGKPLEIDWQKTGRPLNGDTIRPKRNCLIAIKAERDGEVKNSSYTFDYCGFVERLLRSRSSHAPILRQLFFSFSKIQPLTISYDQVIENCCVEEDDIHNFDILYERLDAADVPCHVDSITNYTASPASEEALERDYPPIAFINFSSPR